LPCFSASLGSAPCADLLSTLPRHGFRGSCRTRSPRGPDPECRGYGDSPSDTRPVELHHASELRGGKTGKAVSPQGLRRRPDHRGLAAVHPAVSGPTSSREVKAEAWKAQVRIERGGCETSAPSACVKGNRRATDEQVISGTVDRSGTRLLCAQRAPLHIVLPYLLFSCSCVPLLYHFSAAGGKMVGAGRVVTY